MLTAFRRGSEDAGVASAPVMSLSHPLGDSSDLSSAPGAAAPWQRVIQTPTGVPLGFGLVFLPPPPLANQWPPRLALHVPHVGQAAWALGKRNWSSLAKSRQWMPK